MPLSTATVPPSMPDTARAATIAPFDLRARSVCSPFAPAQRLLPGGGTRGGDARYAVAVAARYARYARAMLANA